MKRLALLAGTALLLPAAPAGAWGMPDLAASEPEPPGVCCASNVPASVVITDCSKTRHGITFRIRIRDEGSHGRVRVSHPRGEGNFREPRVRLVDSAMVRSGDPAPPNPEGTGEVGAGVSLQPYGDRPSFRTSTRDFGTTTAYVKFRLRNGQAVNMSCTMR